MTKSLNTARWPWPAAVTLGVVALGSVAFAVSRDGSGASAAPVAVVSATASARAEGGTRLTRVGADGALIVSVAGLRCGVAAIGPADLRQRAGGEFCLADVAVENAGQEPRLFDGSAQRAVDVHGRAYATDDRSAAFLNDRVPSLLDEIPAATTVRGVLPFDVPAGTRLSALLVHESADSRGARIALN
ncbi:DUF4352 domain-containing protein [Paractinoplanes durhamensis]|uniref:DUF4352 domain-containing protein n=1 Tax=Paractinoplanes durhamensis TaxID=113563 RepID=A0ABQ3Z6L5_9ACTN|nr:DUF4352 domain-containing protein [Actinoplanes durhamensis]GIE05455.1 hypothetical protein Adu01nite_68050 [Actinoplanes durhamensis]